MLSTQGLKLLVRKKTSKNEQFLQFGCLDHCDAGDIHNAVVLIQPYPIYYYRLQRLLDGPALEADRVRWSASFPHTIGTTTSRCSMTSTAFVTGSSGSATCGI